MFLSDDPLIRPDVICCRGSLSVCLAGQCQSVGCDLRLRSRKVLDRCGVCAGDGSSCAQERQRFVWRPGPLSACSTSCGGGQEVWGHLCTDITTGQTVHQEFCDLDTRPASHLRACSLRSCPARSVQSKLSTFSKFGKLIFV